MRPTLRRHNRPVILSPKPRVTVLLLALPVTRAHQIGAWCRINTQLQVITQVIIVRGGSRLAPNATRTPIQCSIKLRHLIVRRTRRIVLPATLVNIGMAMVAPLIRDTKIAANQVAIELVAVAFRFKIMTKEMEDSLANVFFREAAPIAVHP